VITRLEGLELPVDSTAGREACGRIAQGLISRERPDIHNQAIMELGALVCLPRNPLCHACPLAETCVALNKGLTDLLPVKGPKKISRTRYFHYFFLMDKEYTWLRKRSGKDIWHSLFEFPMIETEAPVTLRDIVNTAEWAVLFPDHPDGVGVSGTNQYKHLLTHQTLHASFYTVNGEPGIEDIPGYHRVKITDLDNYAMPRLLVRFLEDIRGVQE
jgi:A/G-specific adenine glycosylase